MKTLRTQKRLAANVLKCSKNKVRLDTSRLDDIKEAITKADIRRLVIEGVVVKKVVKGPSKARIRKNKIQKRKGRRKGQGSRKGKKTARLPKKEAWMNKIRLQRDMLKKLRDSELVDTSTYRDLYRKSSGGFFRSKRHIKLYIEEHNLVKKK